MSKETTTHGAVAGADDAAATSVHPAVPINAHAANQLTAPSTPRPKQVDN